MKKRQHYKTQFSSNKDDEVCLGDDPIMTQDDNMIYSKNAQHRPSKQLKKGEKWSHERKQHVLTAQE